MKGRTPDFVRQRIEWCAKKHRLPYESTGLWIEAPSALRQCIPDTNAAPVVYSMSNNGEATVIGVDDVFVVSRTGIKRISLDQLVGVTSPCVREGKKKQEFDVIELESTKGQRIHLPTETGRACFALWNILLMLFRMANKGEQSTPANCPEPRRSA